MKFGVSVFVLIVSILAWTPAVVQSGGTFTLDKDSDISVSVSSSFGTAKTLIEDMIERHLLAALDKQALTGTGDSVEFTVQAEQGYWYDLNSNALDNLQGLNAFTISTTNGAPDTILIEGNTAVGASFGVMDFFENYLDITWVFPGDLGEIYSSEHSFDIPSGRKSVSPAVASRLVTGYSNRDNGRYGGYPYTGLVQDERNFFKSYDYFKAYGEYQLIHSSHNLINVFPIDEVAANWPQCFPKHPDDSPNPPPAGTQNWHPCFTDPKSIEVAIDKVIDGFTNNRTHTFSLGINDGVSLRCNGSVCSTMTIEESYYHFVQSVATNPAVAAFYPPHMIGVLAYGDASLPPDDLELPENVIVMGTGGTYTHERWNDHAQSQGSYEYLYGIGFWVPNFPLEALRRNAAYYTTNGITLARYEAHPLWAFDGPKLYLNNRLLWDPDYDTDAGLQRYCDAAFGTAASEHMVDLYELAAAISDDEVVPVTNGTSSVWPVEWPWYPWKAPQVEFARLNRKDPDYYSVGLAHLDAAALDVGIGSDEENRLEMVASLFRCAKATHDIDRTVNAARDMHKATDWTDTFSNIVANLEQRNVSFAQMSNNPAWFIGSGAEYSDIQGAEWEGKAGYDLQSDDMLAHAIYRINATSESLGDFHVPSAYKRYLRPASVTSPPTIALHSTHGWYPAEQYVPMTRSLDDDVITFNTETTDATFVSYDLPPWIDLHKGHWLAFYFNETISAGETRLWRLTLDAEAKEGVLYINAHHHDAGDTQNKYSLRDITEVDTSTLTNVNREIVIQPMNYNSDTEEWDMAWSGDLSTGLYVQMVWLPRADTSSFIGTLTISEINFTGATTVWTR